MKGGKKDAFQDFENKTSDAWDDGEDDLLMMPNMSMRDVQSTARAVLDNHTNYAHGHKLKNITTALYIQVLLYTFLNLF
jgi:hypothetical protein